MGSWRGVELTEGAGDTVASLGEIVKSFHDGGTELTPIGGVVIIGGYLGGWAGAGIGFGAQLGGPAKILILILKLACDCQESRGQKWIKLLKTLRKFSNVKT